MLPSTETLLLWLARGPRPVAAALEACTAAVGGWDSAPEGLVCAAGSGLGRIPFTLSAQLLPVTGAAVACLGC